MNSQVKNNQYRKFCAYGFFKNLRFFDAFLILFLIDKNISYTQIGIFYASREIITNLFEIPSGLIADIYGRKKSLATALLLFSISFLIFWISNNFWLYLFAFILFGLADAFRSGSHKGMMMDYLKLNKWTEYKSEYYGYTRSWSQKGSAISALLAGFLIFIDGSYQNIFIYSVIPYLINFFLILTYPSIIDRSEKRKNSFKDSTRDLFRILKQKSVLKLVSTSAFHTAYLKALKDYIQAIMLTIALLLPNITSVDIDRQNGLVIGILYSIIYLLTSYASKYSSVILKKAPKNLTKKTLLLGLLFGLSCGVFFIYKFWIWAFISFALIFIIENIRKPILSVFVADQVPNELLTSVYSAQSQVRTLFSAIIAFAFGILADTKGIGAALVIVSAFMLILSIFILFSKKVYNNTTRK